MSDTVEKVIQEKLAAAAKLLYEAGYLAEEQHQGELSFMGLVFEPGFGWFSQDGELQEASEWNASACVIGSNYAWGYGMRGWEGKVNPEWKHPNK